MIDCHAESLLLHRLLSRCGEWGLLSGAVHGFLIAVASLIVKHGLEGMRASVVEVCGLSSCDVQALENWLICHGTQAWLIHSL